MMRWFGFNGLGALTNANLKVVQAEVNQQLVARGFVPIKVDGILGPATCGAARLTAHPALPEMKCTSFTDPKLSVTGPVIPPPGPNQPIVPGPVGPLGPVGPAPVQQAGMFGMDSKTILIGAGVVAGGIVLVYFLKQRSQQKAA